MRVKSLFFCICLIVFFTPVFAQTHISVPLDNQIYYILEQAELKGLCSSLSGIRPYTRNVILKAINEILEREDDKLSELEREILEDYLEKFSIPEAGLNLLNGSFRGESYIGNNDLLMSVNLGIGLDVQGSAGLYSFGNYFATETWFGVYANGDITNKMSWDVNAEAGLFMAPRIYLGQYYTYYEGYVDYENFQNRLLPVYSQPLTHFPYSYKKRWDGSVHYLSEMRGFDSWPDVASVGINLLSEITTSFLDDKLIMRIGRMNHEWGSSPLGTSLTLNQMSRPFLGFEAEFNPFPWIGLSTMTGFLEFFNTEGEKGSGMLSQNAFSITMIQLKFKKYFFLDIAETVVWPKRFELGYIFPLTSSIVYKGNQGDFDNLGLSFNLRAQYPGLGNIWLSLFWDEARIKSNLNELDRTMVAIQAGMSFTLPYLAFSSAKLSYTKVNPYCYTHTREYTPWYGGNIPMETRYVNNGVSLGYYIPPNSDELLLSIRTMPIKSLSANLQYQLIRHGADYGSSAVDGSSLLSELDPHDRDFNPVLRRFFLQDGAYQWMHILKASVEWKVPRIPVTFYGEAGINYSFFTNINAPANITGTAHTNSKIDTDEYPKSRGFIIKLGVRIFPVY